MTAQSCAKPPSTAKSAPITYRDSSLARKTTHSATFGHLDGFAEAASGRHLCDARRHLLQLLRWQTHAPVNGRVNRPGADAVHANVPRDQFRRKRSRQAAHRRLGRGIETQPGHALGVEDRGGEDDRAARRGEMRHGRLHSEEDALDVGGEDVVELRVGGGGQRRERRDARVEEEHVQPAMLGFHGLDHPAHLRRAGGIGFEGHRPGRATLGNRFVERRRRAPGDGYPRAFFDEPLRGDAANAAATAGDQRHFAFESWFHAE